MNRLFRTLALFSLLATASQLSAQVLASETLTWKAKSGVSHGHCDNCRTIPITLPGPGTLAVRLQMEPYQRREFATSAESILTYPGLAYVAELVSTTYNGSRIVPSAEAMVGKPADLVVTWKYSQNKPAKFDLFLKNPVKCGLGDCDQRAATAQLTVTFTPAGSAGGGASPAPSPGGVTGTWVRTQNGRVIDRMEIVASGDGFKVELRDGEDRPLYASGFGVLQGNRLVVATRNSGSGVSGLLILTFSGDRVHYRSYFIDGRMSWDGEFLRRK